MIHNRTSLTRLVNEGMREYGIALHGVGKSMEEAREGIRKGYSFPQTLYMSCGYKDKVESFDQIPLFNVPCPCGNPNHWIVKYDIPIKPGRLYWLRKFFRR